MTPTNDTDSIPFVLLPPNSKVYNLILELQKFKNTKYFLRVGWYFDLPFVLMFMLLVTLNYTWIVHVINAW